MMNGYDHIWLKSVYIKLDNTLYCYTIFSLLFLANIHSTVFHLNKRFLPFGINFIMKTLLYGIKAEWRNSKQIENTQNRDQTKRLRRK